MKTVRCTALVEFVRPVDGFGMVVGAPESSLEEAKSPEVPEHLVDAFVADGLVAAPKGKAAKKVADGLVAAEAPASDEAPA